MATESAVSPRLEARACAHHLRLCLRERSWQGSQGNWAGAGIGSSIDFQDHRPYMPGDDPRYIDWAAYARSGQTIMKLYREEVSPRMDLVMDVSRSMFFDPDKRAQSLRLFFFCMESALAMNASLQVYLVAGSESRQVDPDRLRHPDWEPEAATESGGVPALDRLPFRNSSIRLFLSDGLYDSAPEVILQELLRGKGRGLLLLPYLEREANPDWLGNMELRECEQARVRRQRVDASLLKRYREAYARHVRSWRDTCRRYQTGMARVPCDRGLGEALKAEALPNGLVEVWG